MCIETIEVRDIASSRDAYEVSEYLKGVPGIDGAVCDELTGKLIVDYDETMLERDKVLDEIEHAGCQPRERMSTGALARLKRAAGF